MTWVGWLLFIWAVCAAVNLGDYLLWEHSGEDGAEGKMDFVTVWVCVVGGPLITLAGIYHRIKEGK